mmetsp:Transcript_7498/g.21902  ORF Transcript_7498/g.21902 Transcript_7498/m.21902 type:complete len:171 (-) Transcript_7498:98-610(-)
MRRRTCWLRPRTAAWASWWTRLEDAFGSILDAHGAAELRVQWVKVHALLCHYGGRGSEGMTFDYALGGRTVDGGFQRGRILLRSLRQRPMTPSMWCSRRCCATCSRFTRRRATSCVALPRHISSLLSSPLLFSSSPLSSSPLSPPLPQQLPRGRTGRSSLIAKLPQGTAR